MFRKFLIVIYFIGNQNPSPFSCPNCGRSYKYQKGLKRHLDIECGKEPLNVCPVCPKRMKHRSNLYQHARTVHGIELSSSRRHTETIVPHSYLSDHGQGIEY